MEDFDRLADVPAFDPDRAAEPILVIDDWRRRVSIANVALVATPEYAGGVAGAVKHAFDWLVGSGEMYRKQVAVLQRGYVGRATCSVHDGPNAHVARCVRGGRVGHRVAPDESPTSTAV